MYSKEQLHELYVYMFQYLFENSDGLTPEVLDMYLGYNREFEEAWERGASDTYIISFFRGLGMTDSRDGTFDLNAFLVMVDEIRKTDPTATLFIVDRLIYLIGSGDFYNSNITYSGCIEDYVGRARDAILEM